MIERHGQLIGVATVARGEHLHPLPQLGSELRGPDDLCVVAEAEHPGDELARVRVGRREDAALPIISGAQLPVAAEVALYLPRDLARDPDIGVADRLAELPLDAVGVAARIEIGGTLEVVLGLGRVADLALDAGEPEDADRVALMRAPDDVELAALEQQLVGVESRSIV